MKKKLLAIALCVCTVFSMAACGKSDDKDASGNGTSKTGVNTSPKGELTLGQYKGYEVAESATVVGEDKVQKYIDAILEMFATEERVQEGTLEEGMKIEITYTETIEGSEDAAKEPSTTKMELKADSFVVDGFVEGLIGKNVGETVEMDLKFADDYTDEALAGKGVHYSVTINAILNKVLPEYNDEFVSKNYAFAGFSTAADFTEFIRKEIYYIQINNSIWEDMIEGQKVVSYPADELSDYVNRSFKQIQDMMTSYGYTMDVYYKNANLTEEKLLADLEEDCKPIVKEKMFVRAVAEKEGIKYSEDAAAKYAAISGYTSVKAFEEYLTELGEELEYSVISYLVQNWVCDNAKIVPNKEVETTAAASAEETTAQSETTAE